MPKIGDYETHPIADAFPLLEGAHWERFLATFSTGLVIKDGWLYEGKILDGRNRYRAALELGLKMKWHEYTGDDPIAFVRAMNFDGRRNMSPSVSTMVACRLHALRPAGRGRKKRSSTDLTRGEVATQFGVSVSSMEQGDKVLAKAAPEVVAAIERTELTISEALELVELPPDKQREALLQREQEVTARAKRASVRKQAPRNDEQLSPKAAAQQLVRSIVKAVEHLGATVQSMQARDGGGGELLIAYAGQVFSVSLQTQRDAA